jgi:D-alanyl-D-alanine carboxypeptidase
MTATRRDVLTLGIAVAAAGTLRIRETLAAGTSARYRDAFDALDRYVARYLREMNAPGMTLALADRSGVQRVVTYGFGEPSKRVRPDELFQIGSISKSFAALALLQLRDEGKLDLHRPIVDYLPWLRIQSAFEPVTTHHLLTHSSGLPGNGEVFPADPAEKLLAAYPPGKQFWYNNCAFAILGLLVETLDGRPFPGAVRQRLFAPLGMRQSEPVIDFETRRREVASYAPLLLDRPNARYAKLVRAPAIVFTDASGCLSCTAEDMGRYVQMLANGGAIADQRLLSADSFGLFSKRHIPAEEFGAGVSYGYGIAVDELDGHRVVRHTGGMVSFMSSLWVDLDAGLGGFASINAQQGYRPNPVVRYALQLMRAAAENGRQPAAPAPDDAAVVPNARDFAGTFTGASGALQFAAEHDRLFLVQAGRRLPVTRLGEDRFAVDDAMFDRFDFSFARAAGKVTELKHGGDWYAGAAYTGPREFEVPEHFRAYIGHYHNESPWAGSLRVFCEKGKLTLDGTPIEPEGDLFRLRDEPANAEWLRFGDVVNGRCRTLKFSGVDYRRVLVD